MNEYSDKISRLEQRARDVAARVVQKEKAERQAELNRRKSLFESDISRAEDIATYWANADQIPGMYGIDKKDADDIAERIGGYRPRALRDTVVGFGQTFGKSPTEELYQEKLKELQAQGLGVPSAYIRDVKRNAIDREQRQLWAGLGAGLLHNWYKKGIAPVDALTGDYRDFLPSATEAELKFGAGKVGAYTGTAAGLAASVYGTGAILKALGVAGATAQSSLAAQEIIKQAAIKTGAEIGIKRGVAALAGDIAGASLETAVFDVLRGEEDWIDHQGYAAGTMIALHGLGLPAKVARRIANKRNVEKILPELVNTAVLKTEPTISQSNRLLRDNIGSINDDIVTRLGSPDDRLKFLAGTSNLDEISRIAPVKEIDFQKLVKDNADLLGKKAIDFDGYDDYLRQFSDDIATQRINVINDTIDNLSVDARKNIAKEFLPAVEKPEKYTKFLSPEFRQMFEDFNLKEFIRLNKNSFGDYRVKNLTPNDARTILDRLDDMYRKVDAGLIPNIEERVALVGKQLRKEYSGIGLVKTGMTKLKEWEKKFVTPEGMSRGDYPRFKVIQEGLEKIKEATLDAKKMADDMKIDLLEKRKEIASYNNILRRMRVIDATVSRETKMIKNMQNKTIRGLERTAIRSLSDEKAFTKERILQGITDAIKGEGDTITGKKFETYRKMANKYLKDIDEYFASKATNDIAQLRVDAIDYHSKMISDIAAQFEPEYRALADAAALSKNKIDNLSEEILTKGDLVNRTKQAIEKMNKHDIAIVDDIGKHTYSARLQGNKYVVDMGDMGMFTLPKDIKPEKILAEMAGFINAKNGFIANAKNLNLGVYSYLSNMIVVSDKLGMPFISRLIYNADLAISSTRHAYKEVLGNFEKALKSADNIAYTGASNGKDAYLKSMQRVFKALDGRRKELGLPLNNVERDAYLFLRKSLKDLAVKQDLPIESIRKEYITHVISPEYRNQMMREFYDRYGNLTKQQAKAIEFDDATELWSGALNDIKYSKETIDEINNNFLRARQAGAPVVEDAFFAFERYLDEALPKIHYTPALENINHFMYMNKERIPLKIQEYINGWLRDTATKQGSDLTKKINQGFGDTIKNLAESLKEFPLPQFVKDNLDKIDYSNPKMFDKAVTSVLRWAYASKMAYNPTSPITNYFQKMLIVPFADMGDVAKFARPKYRPGSMAKVIIDGGDYGTSGNLLNKCTLLQQRIQSGAFSSAPEVVGEATGRVSKGIDKVIDVGFTGFRLVDLDNVKTAYLAGFSKAIKSGQSVDDAIRYANYVAETTQFIYSRGTRSAVNRSPVKLLTTFSTWSMGYMNYWQEVARLFGPQGVTRGMATQFAIPLLLTAMTGNDFSRYTPSQIMADFISGKTEQMANLVNMMPGVTWNIVALDKAKKAIDGKPFIFTPVDSDAPRNKAKINTLGQWLFGNS